MAKGQTVRDLTAALRGEQTNTDFWLTNLSIGTTAATYGPYTFTCNNANAALNTSFTMAFYLAKGVISDVWIDKVIVKDISTGIVSVSGLSISPSRLVISPGQTGQLSRTLTPANPTNNGVNWSSNNTEIATVNSNSLVTGGIPLPTRLHVA